MIRSLTLALFAALTAVSANAACPAPSYKLNDLVLTADGKVLRTDLVEKLGDSQNKNSSNYVPVVRDTITLEQGDELLLNAAPKARDVILQAKITFVSQNRDSLGIFSTTYRVNEYMTGTFGGVQTPSRSVKTYLAKVVSNYAGNGSYAKTCDGQVIRTMIDGK